MFSYARGFAPCIPGTEPEAALGQGGGEPRTRRGLVPVGRRLTLPLWCPAGGLNPSGTCSPCPGGEDHLKRRSSSPPVPPLLGCRHCPKKGGSVCFAPKHKLLSALGACLAGTISAARVQSRGCKGRSPLHEITLVSPFPPGRGAGGWGQETKLKVGFAGGKEGTPPQGTTATKFISAAGGLMPGCRGRSPRRNKLWDSPFPPGRGSGGWGKERKLKAGLAGDCPPSPPAGHHSGKVSR